MALRSKLLPVLLGAAMLPLLPGEASAQTRTGPCVVGQSQPRCLVEYGRTPLGATDGDTIPVRIDGRGGYARVRLTGVQAMELSDYVNKIGECRAAEATLRVTAMLRQGRNRVRLAEQSAGSSSRNRPLRSMSVRIRGRWIDVGEDLMRRGLAIRLNHDREDHFNERYALASERARRLQLGLFDPDACGAGFQEGLPIQLWVNADPPGNDIDHLDEEYVVVRNNDPVQALDLSGWWVRDGGLRRYTFPAGTLVGPGQTQTLRVGQGVDAPGEAFWGLRTAVFDNPTSAENGARGDGAYLFDPEGDIRASMIYPCRFECGDGLADQLDIQVKPTGSQERITITSRAAVPVTLHGYRLGFRTRLLHFGAGDVLAPGESLRIDVQGYPDEDRPGVRGWNQVGPILPNRNGHVRVETYDDVLVGCGTWGAGTCG